MHIKTGQIFAFYAFDAGYEIDLQRISQILKTELARKLIKKKTAPTYIQYQTPPLTIPMGEYSFRLVDMPMKAEVTAKVFDFGAISIAYRMPFSCSLSELNRYSAALLYDVNLDVEAKRFLEELFLKIKPAVKKPSISEIVEDYFIFQVTEFEKDIGAKDLRKDYSMDIAKALRFESGGISENEVNESLKNPVSYYENDMVITDWNAAFVYDSDYVDTIDVLEFTNVELVELRFNDGLLDKRLIELYDKIYESRRYFTYLFNPYDKTIRTISELKVEVSVLFERIDNTIKLIGDIYLAKVYNLTSDRFHFDKWEKGIEKKLSAIESIYVILNNRLATIRAETLETVIIILIVVEIILGLTRG
jgi:hypothetical protein